MILLAVWRWFSVNTCHLPMKFISLAQCWRRTVDACRGLPLNASSGEIEKVLNRLLERLSRCLTQAKARTLRNAGGVGTPGGVPHHQRLQGYGPTSLDGDVEGEILVTLGFGR
jgi:hypothetical protein